MKEVRPTADDQELMSAHIYVEPFTRYVMYVEAQPVATKRFGAISNMLVFTTDMSGQYITVHVHQLLTAHSVSTVPH